MCADRFFFKQDEHYELRGLNDSLNDSSIKDASEKDHHGEICGPEYL